MPKELMIEARPRALQGKRASRKLARQGLLPGVFYGGGETPVLFQIDPRELDAVLHSEAGTNTLFRFSVAGTEGQHIAMIKEYQQDPVTGRLLHADLLRISLDKPIQVRVPVHIAGTAKGVKQQGGILDFVLRDIEISCLPGDIPERIDADVTELELGQGIKVSDLKIGEKVKVLTDPNKPVAVVVAPAAERAAEAAAAAVVPEAPAEPEVIKKGKAEAVEGEAESGEKAAAPREKGAAPREKGAAPREKGAAPREKGAAPREKAEKPAGKEKGGR